MRPRAAVPPLGMPEPCPKDSGDFAERNRI
jgi:hypothetical protein